MQNLEETKDSLRRVQNTINENLKTEWSNAFISRGGFNYITNKILSCDVETILQGQGSDDYVKDMAFWLNLCQINFEEA